jgi:hypothetical protein
MSFQAPIGTAEERASGIIWPGFWTDETPYGKPYKLGDKNPFHTGADLNLNAPHFDQDAHSDVSAMGDGTVIFAHRFHDPKSWGNIIVIDHGELEGKPLLSRYAHVEGIMVAENTHVQMGQPIARVGNGFGLFSFHLHFDISVTDALRTNAGDWPGENLQGVLDNYVNPKDWLQGHVTAGTSDQKIHITREYFIIAKDGVLVRSDHRRSASQAGSLLLGAKVFLADSDSDTVTEDSFIWGQISGSELNGNWMAMGHEDKSEMFVSKSPPNT